MRPRICSVMVCALGIAGSISSTMAITQDEDASMQKPPSSVSSAPFGQLDDGREVALYRLVNANGMEMAVTPYGGTIVSLKVPDDEGNLDDIVLGFEHLEDYLAPAYQRANPYFGALIGRYGNRIAGASFSIDGKTYRLPANDGDNHLHGGTQGFDRRLWQAQAFEEEHAVGLLLTLESPDGDQGYPGTLRAQVRYTLADDNALDIRYEASTTATTPVNLTQHSYFNLDGEGSGDILAHRLMINASGFTPVDDALIPLGEVRSLDNSPLDFRTPVAIGRRIDEDDQQLLKGKGYDHNFVINRGEAAAEELVLAARVEAPLSGRVMEVYTSEPGIQFYSGNFLDGSLTGKSGVPYQQHSGFALETQHYPDSPNQPDFPSTLLTPEETYLSHTRYVFSSVPQ